MPKFVSTGAYHTSVALGLDLTNTALLRLWAARVAVASVSASHSHHLTHDGWRLWLL
jgi:hypothetical protein